MATKSKPKSLGHKASIRAAHSKAHTGNTSSQQHDGVTAKKARHGHGHEPAKVGGLLAKLGGRRHHKKNHARVHPGGQHNRGPGHGGKVQRLAHAGHD